MTEQPEPPETAPRLRRSLSLTMLVLYGLGTTIGAGIYALIGEIAGTAGMLAPWSFLLASLLAACTALSFGELAARFPRAAAEAVYVEEAFGWPRIAALVGLLVVLAGTVSSATILNAFAGYFREFVDLPSILAIPLVALALGGLVAWGIRESVLIAGLITLAEVGGLGLVIWVARDGLLDVPSRLNELVPAFDPSVWSGVFGAGLLAFYAFLGFEDMVNVAEEVKDVERTMPLGIVVTLVLTTLIYFLVALVAVLAVPPEQLAAGAAPLALLYERATGSPATLISLIGTVAVVNGAMIQMIMASRVLYGLAERGALPRRLSYVHPRTRTPVMATAAVAAAVVVLALWFPITRLAEATSVITLTIFVLVNAALWRIKRTRPSPAGVAIVPAWVPVVGLVVSAGFVLYGLAG